MYIDSYINLYIQLAWIDTYGCMYVIYVGSCIWLHISVCVRVCVRRTHACHLGAICGRHSLIYAAANCTSKWMTASSLCIFAAAVVKAELPFHICPL